MLKLKLETDNQAFDQEGQEVARILRDLANRLENLDKLQECQQPLRDLNGNTVGYYTSSTEQLTQQRSNDQARSRGGLPYQEWR